MAGRLDAGTLCSRSTILLAADRFAIHVSCEDENSPGILLLQFGGHGGPPFSRIVPGVGAVPVGYTDE